MKTIGEWIGSQEIPLPARMARWTDSVLYSPYVGSGPSRRLEEANAEGWHRASVNGIIRTKSSTRET